MRATPLALVLALGCSAKTPAPPLVVDARSPTVPPAASNEPTDSASTRASARLPRAPRPSMAHEPCDVEGPQAEPVDLNGDRIPDVVRVRSASGQASCRAADFTFDGRPDVYEYYANDGAVRRTERDLDGDGRIDVVVVDCTTYTDSDGDGTADSTRLVADCN